MFKHSTHWVQIRSTYKHMCCWTLIILYSKILTHDPILTTTLNQQTRPTGSNGVGVANSIGASSLAILLSLGLPWFLQAVILEAQSAPDVRTYVVLFSNGVEYTLLSLLPMILLVFLTLWLRKFMLTKRTGLILFIFYALFITFAILVEVDVLFKPNYCWRTEQALEPLIDRDACSVLQVECPHQI